MRICVLLQHIKNNAEILQNTARHHKNMEYRMHIAVYAFPRNAVKHSAHRVRNSACEQPHKAGRSDRVYCGFSRENYAPAERQIADYRKDAVFFKIDRVKGNAERRNAPYYSEYRPAECGACPPERAEGDRSICTCDKYKHGAVIYDLHDLFGGFGLETVIDA